MLYQYRYKYLLYIFVAHFLLLGCASHNNDDSTQLSITINDNGSGRASLKYYDASEGCPSYNDFPAAPDYIGQSKVKNTQSIMQLPLNSKIHVFYFKPRQTPLIMASGGAAEIRRRSAQITLTGGPANLNFGIDENDKIKWSSEGGIKLEPGTSCSTN